MCYRLALAEGTIRSGRKYGRRGQEQHGVDIIGRSEDPKFCNVGIQCKLKTEHLGGKLTAGELKDVYELATTLKPPLDKLYVATTSPRDTAVADLVDRINESWQRRHFVEAWCWEDICDMLDAHEKVAARYYPDLISIDALQRTPKDPVELFLGPGSECNTKERLSKLFEHQMFRGQFGGAQFEVTNALSEYVLNCLHVRKGEGRRIAISLDGTELVVEDDGNTFNPLDQGFEPKPDQLGVRTIRGLARNQQGLEVQYIPKEADEACAFNRFVIRVQSMEGIATQSCSVHVDAGELFSRQDGFAYFDQMKIPADCDPFTVHIGTFRLVTSSGTHEVLRQLKSYLGERKLVVMVAPHRSDLYEALEPSVATWPNVSLKMG